MEKILLAVGRIARKKILLCCFIFFLAPVVEAATIYVDNTLGGSCTGNYSIANRACNGSNGNAYTTVGAAINAMSAGDHIVIRGGTYTGCYDIPTSKNPANGSWTAGHYNKISSCGTEEGCSSNEWAILDGNFSCGSNGGAVLGHVIDETNGSADIKYWWLERLEIKNGRNAGGTNGHGFYGNGGPFKVRYCYIHDNKGVSGASQCDDLPGGTNGHSWHDSLIEYSYYKDNGGTAQNNCKQITWVTSYPLTDNIERNGLSIPNYATGGYMSSFGDVVDVRNEIRYNIVEGGTVGIGIKHFSWFTGRNTAGSDYSDTYKDAAPKIHHNIVRNTLSYGIGAHFDFAQIYNNILDNNAYGIKAMYDYWTDDNAYAFHYKVTAYNNTIIAPTSHVGYIGLGRRWADWINPNWYGYIYNNICDTCGQGGGDYSYESGITPKVRHSSETRSMTYTNGVISNNYFYRPRDTSLYNTFYNTVYTNTTWESQTDTGSPKQSLMNAYNAGNLLYVGTTGADKYRIRSAHVVEGSSTAATAGIGGSHPFLSGVTIPSYVGAVNPADDAWVNGVLGLVNTATLRSSGSGDPSWIEGSGSPQPTTHTVTPSAGSGGSISPNTAQTVNDGSTIQFTITPSNGYTASVGGTCGGSLSGTTYTTNAITANCTVAATFTAVPTYTIGGSISNLSGSITLTDTNAGSVTASGSSFVLPNELVTGASYNVTISTQPTGQICTVSHGSGTVAYASVTNISISCVSSYTVGGLLSGFSGNGTVTVRNNGGDDLHLASNGSFTFPTALVSGSNYLVSIPTQPSGQTCAVSNGTGTITGANITSVTISCSGTTTKVPSTVQSVSVH